MTQPDTTPSTTPELRDPVGELTLAELDAGSRLLQHDLVDAAQPGHQLRNAALPVVAWLMARREDRKAQLATYRAKTLDQLLDDLFPGAAAALAAAEDARRLAVEAAAGAPLDDQLDDQLDVDDLVDGQLPDAGDQAELDELDDDARLVAEVTARPTAPRPAS